jgi:hypothetical protein
LKIYSDLRAPDRFVDDSLLEGDGFEPSVPPKERHSFQIGVEASWSEIGTVARRLIDREFTGKAVLHVL